MPKAAEPILHPLVAVAQAIIAQIAAAEIERVEKAKVLEPIDKNLKELKEQLAAKVAEIVALGGGRYRDEADHIGTVVPEIPATKQPDRFVLPDGALPTARDLAGDHFRKLFDRVEIFTPRNGFDAIAELLLTPKKARELVALCLVPGEPKGGRAAHLRWAKA